MIHDAAGLIWAVNLGSASTSTRTRCGPRIWTIPTRLRIDLDPLPGSSGRRSATSPLWCASPRDHGLTPWPKPPARAGFTFTHRSHRAGPSPRFGWPRRRWRAKSSAGRRTWPPANGGSRNGTGCSSTSTRTPRTAPWRRPARCAPIPMRGCRHRCCGTRCRTAGPNSSPSTRAAALRRPRRPVDRNGEDGGSLDALLRLAEELSPRARAQRCQTADRDRAHQTRDGRWPPWRWRGRHPAAAPLLHAADVLVDGVRGPSSIWYRIRINLEHVPEADRPPQETLIADWPVARYSGRTGRP